MPTYDECRDEYKHKMGVELGVTYHLLWNECVLLHQQWDEYVEMFGKNQEQFDVMNSVAPGFFKSVQDALWERTLLHLCKFADNRTVGHRKTLSLDTLLAFPASQQVPGLKTLVTNAKGRIKFAQDWRNRHIAHNDLEHARDRPAKPLAPASRNDVKEALKAIGAVLGAVEEHFTGSGLIFNGTGPRWGGTYLLSELRLVSRLRHERDQRIKSGQATEDDLDWQKWH